MSKLLLNIVRFVEEHQPNIVECELIDAQGQSHLFVEKSAIVSTVELWPTSTYPLPGVVACEIEEEWKNEAGSFLRVNTARPWSVESIAGETVFVVNSSQVQK
jgi:hypothetical protein